jgi:hypothetical protein
LRALLVPAGTVPAEVIEVGETAQAISDAIGGHLLDDTTIGELPGGLQVTFYRSEDPYALPDNPAAVALAVRTAATDRRTLARLRGPVLVLGLDGARDVSIPDELIVVARQTGLSIRAEAVMTPPGNGARR